MGPPPLPELATLEGQAVAAFNLVNVIDGATFRVPGDKGRATLVYFFATTCAACDRNEESWTKLAALFGDRADLFMVSPEDPIHLKTALDGRVPEGVVVGTIEAAMADLVRSNLRMFATPTLYLIDSSGILAYTKLGLFGAEVESAVLRHL
jgi:hypothetical protein